MTTFAEWTAHYERNVEAFREAMADPENGGPIADDVLRLLAHVATGVALGPYWDATDLTHQRGEP